MAVAAGRHLARDTILEYRSKQSALRPRPSAVFALTVTLPKKSVFADWMSKAHPTRIAVLAINTAKPLSAGRVRISGRAARADSGGTCGSEPPFDRTGESTENRFHRELILPGC